VCEGSPHFGGHVLAKSLAEAGIDTTVIHDAATYAIMARVNKVLLPAHAVLVSILRQARGVVLVLFFAEES
jgi:translation initiation factor eIF-2B subunit beta